MGFERIFPEDKISKRERVERALRHEKVDRAPLHDQLSYNPGVIARIIGRPIKGYEYSAVEIGMAVRLSLDCSFPLFAPVGTDSVTDEDGFAYRHENWMTWRISRPFHDAGGATAWLHSIIEREKRKYREFDPSKERNKYHQYMLETQRLMGETVFMDYPVGTGFCDLYDRIGLDLFSLLAYDTPHLIGEYVQWHTDNAIRFIRAAADNDLSPVTLIAEDIATKQGPIFSPAMLEEFHVPFLKPIIDAWHDKGMKAIYHSDGNYKKAVQSIVDCGIDGFYCLEPNCGMDIVELKRQWPDMVWMGGVDGVDLMERGCPEAVADEVHRQIRQTGALDSGGIFIGSSSEINPPIPPDNFIAMIQAVGDVH